VKRGKPISRKKSKKLSAYARELDKLTPALMDRAGWKCEIRVVPLCAGNLERHHRLPRSHGGKNTMGNLLIACSDCHDYIEKHREESYERGWLIKSGAVWVSNEVWDELLDVPRAAS
jgi:5-methylcytosine-specific restriction endonuclease McrA